MEEIERILSQSNLDGFKHTLRTLYYPPIHLAVDGIAVDLFNQLDEDEIHLKEVIVPLVTLT